MLNYYLKYIIFIKMQKNNITIIKFIKYLNIDTILQFFIKFFSIF